VKYPDNSPHAFLAKSMIEVGIDIRSW